MVVLLRLLRMVPPRRGLSRGQWIGYGQCAQYSRLPRIVRSSRIASRSRRRARIELEGKGGQAMHKT